MTCLLCECIYSKAAELGLGSEQAQRLQKKSCEMHHGSKFLRENSSPQAGWDKALVHQGTKLFPMYFEKCCLSSLDIIFAPEILIVYKITTTSTV